MKAIDVTLTTGASYGLKKPTLGGWERLLSILTDEDYDALFGAVLSVATAPQPDAATEQERNAVAGAMEQALTIGGTRLLKVLPRMPKLLAACMSECLVNKSDGKRSLSMAQALELDDEDADRFVAAVAESGMVGEIVARLKNRLSRKPSATAQPAPSA